MRDDYFDGWPAEPELPNPDEPDTGEYRDFGYTVARYDGERWIPEE